MRSTRELDEGVAAAVAAVVRHRERVSKLRRESAHPDAIASMQALVEMFEGALDCMMASRSLVERLREQRR